jgi:hypothetical protein
MIERDKKQATIIIFLCASICEEQVVLSDFGNVHANSLETVFSPWQWQLIVSLFANLPIHSSDIAVC